MNLRNQVTRAIEDHMIPGAGYLAGYARSGAALVRTILANVLGHRTSTIYEESDLGSDYARFLGHLHPAGEVERIAAIAAGQGVLFFKTHNRADSAVTVPTIIAVRDGRRVMASLRAFYLERNKVDYPWSDLIRGLHPWGNWSAWVASWALHSPDDALWLRYEDSIADPLAAAKRIARRFGFASPSKAAMPDFSEMRAASPTIFRKAAVKGNGGMPPEAEDLFWKLHGGTMSMLGYARE